ncbi:hybrid sensor histidine kinase/response regulator [Streptomyces nogalater]|uniref:hybrid sensor histidine kinase/response regulator n=1 Tax=Streptomyces nogalater TaxID=38314 RepID=UPI0031E1EBF8
MSSRPSRGAARLAAILDALPDALVLVNANGTVVNANTIALEAFETPGTALVGRGLLDLLPQFDSRLIPGSMRRPDHMAPQGRTKPTRMVARRTDGTEFPVEVTSASLENGQQAYDGYGYTGDELLMIVVRDLSGTIDTEAELARSQRQTEMILRAAAEGVVGTDTDGRIVLVNPAAAQILGYRAGELGGKELHTLVLHSRADGSPFPYEESPLADTLRSGRKHRVRGQVLWSKGDKKVPVDLTTAPVRDGDQLVGAVMTFTDRRPYDAVVEEKAALEKAHAEELERLAEEHASDLTALRQQHVTEVEELREQHGTEIEELREKHAEELAAGEERYAALAEREKDRYEVLSGRHEQLLTLLGQSLRGPLDELRRELSALAADDAGQLWPEANQVLHHLSAGYSRITTLIDNVLGYQRLDAGTEDITRTKVMLDAVVAAGVDGAVELIGPGRVQFAVHAPPIEAEVDPQRLAVALAHLVADVAGVDATGNTPVSAGGYLDNTVVIAAAQRGEVARIEVRGPYAGGDPVHEPIVRGIVRAHGGVLQTHEVPGMSGSAYVLEVPLGGGAGAVAPQVPDAVAPQVPDAVGARVVGAVAGAPLPDAVAGAPLPDAVAGGPLPDVVTGAPLPDAGDDSGAAEQSGGGGRRRARRSNTDAFLESDLAGAGDTGEIEAPVPTGRRRRRAAVPAGETDAASAEGAENASGGTGRRRARPADGASAGTGVDVVGAGAGTTSGTGAGAGTGKGDGVAEGAVVTSAEQSAGAAASGTGLGGTVPPQGVPVGTGRRARHEVDAAPQAALPPALPAVVAGAGAGGEVTPGARAVPVQGGPVVPAQGGQADGVQGGDALDAEGAQPGGRRRRALAAAAERAAAQEASGPRTVFALPPAEADRSPEGTREAQGTHGTHGTEEAPAAVSGTAPAPSAATGTGTSTSTSVPVAPGADSGTAASVTPGAGVPADPSAGVPLAPGTGAAVAPSAATPMTPNAAAPVGPNAGAPMAPNAGAPVAPGAGVAEGGRPRVPGAGPLPGQVQLPAQMPVSVEGLPGLDGRHDAVPLDQADDHTPPQPHPTSAPTGRRRRAVAQPAETAQAVAPGTVPGQSRPLSRPGAPGQMPQGTAVPPVPGQHTSSVPAPSVPAQGTAAQGTIGQGTIGQGIPVQGGPVAPGAQPGTAVPAPAPAQGRPGQPTPGQPAPTPAAPAPVVSTPSAPASATPPQGTPSQGTSLQDAAGQSAPAQAPRSAAATQPGTPAAGTPVAGPGPLPLPAEAAPGQAPGAQPVPVPPVGGPAAGAPPQWAGAGDTAGAGTPLPPPGTPAQGTPLPTGPTGAAEAAVPTTPTTPHGGQPPRAAQPLPAEAAGGGPVDPDSTQGRAISVRTLGQGVPFARQAAQVQQPTATPPPHAPGGSGRRRKLGTPPDPAARQEARPDQGARPHPVSEPVPGHPAPVGRPPAPQPSPTGQPPMPGRPAPGTEGAGRSYAIGAPEPDAAEGPEPLDGPGGAVEVADTPRPQPLDDELPPEPLDNPRRLLVWPAPDVTTQQALSDRGYRPVIVHSREEVDAQIAAFPAALFVDPLTGPITRTALQSLRQAAVAAEVPVLVTAGLGQASREAAYGADPAVLLKALAPRDSEQHPPRVLLIEEHPEIALALTTTLERRGMQVARAASDNDAVTLAGQFRPNLVVMDLMQVHRRRAGIVDWLRANGQLNRTPLVVYTAAVDQADLPRLASGETVLFLAERSTSTEVQSRIVDLLARIGTN